MNTEELEGTLKHCHKALGDSLRLVSDLLSQQGNPDEIIQRIEKNQAMYNAITQLMREHNGE